MFGYLIDFLFPKKCVGCDVYGKDLCNKCFRELSIADDQICPECGEESAMGWTHPRCKKELGMDGLIVIYDYQDEVSKKVIDGIKFDFNKNLIKDLLKNFRFETGEKFDYLVPVPLHFYRENWRGFNQAEETALVVGKRMKIRVFDVLVRKRRTKQQSLILDRKEREKNVKGAFEVSRENNKALKGKKVLLVDDVFTSGADMRECTKILKKAGVEIVWGLALAH
ncbi:MAG TPA: ComF family protein [Spirochaetia bacterium]|nr:ComF family protein [Spirochaetia bacterium]